MPQKKTGRPAARPAHKAPAKAPEQTSGRGSRKEFDNTNRGVLFENDKQGNEARPDNTGKIFVQIPEGAKPGEVIEFRLAGWLKEMKSGGQFLSLVVSLPQEKN